MAWCGIYFGFCFIFLCFWRLLALQNFSFQFIHLANYRVQHVCSNLQCGLGCYSSFTHVMNPIQLHLYKLKWFHSFKLERDERHCCHYLLLLFFLQSPSFGGRRSLSLVIFISNRNHWLLLFKVYGELHHTEFNKQSSFSQLPQCFYNGLHLSAYWLYIVFSISPVIAMECYWGSYSFKWS